MWWLLGLYALAKALEDKKEEPTPTPEPSKPMSELDRVLTAPPSYHTSSSSDDDYYPDYEGEDLEDAEND